VADVFVGDSLAGSGLGAVEDGDFGVDAGVVMGVVIESLSDDSQVSLQSFSVFSVSSCSTSAYLQLT